MLETDNGRISIVFPAGSVIEPVNIMLRDYPLDQLPPLPPGFEAGSTCFRVEGLSGLLLKDAGVNVGYTGADLETADGNTSRLRLAYWDKAKGEWAVLRTTVNKTNMTLSANTNYFSIWSILIAPEPSANLPLIIGSTIGGLLIAGIVAVLLRKRNRIRSANFQER